MASATACSSNKSQSTNSSAASEKAGGNLRIAVQSGPRTLFLPKSSTTSDKIFAEPVLEQLGRPDSKGIVQPWLAKSFTDDAKNLTLTIKLRPNIKFTDGSSCDAKAVKWNIDQCIKNGQASTLDNPASVSIVDNLTVQVKFNSFSNDWDAVFGNIQILSEQSYEKNGENWCATHMIGTGPYVLQSFAQDSKLTFKKNTDYRIKGQPYLDSIEMDIIPDAGTQVSAFKNNEVDVIFSTNNPTIIMPLQNAGFKSTAQNAPDLANMGYFMFNTKDTSQPLSNLKVRQAIMHGIDFKNVAKSLTNGLGTYANQFSVPGAFSYNKDVKLYDYDVKKAKSMLAEAGYPNGFNTKIYVNNVTGNSQMAVALQASLRDIGIKASIITEDSSLLSSQQVKDSLQGMIVNVGASQMDFTVNYTRLYSSKGIKNHGMLAYPKAYENALFTARLVQNLDQKKNLLQQCSKILTQDSCMVIPLYVIYMHTFTQENVHDTGVNQTNLTVWTPESARIK
jgi:ABC-type transport system substrate-binding protein